MGAIESEIFKAGDRIAVSLPDGWGLEPGARVTIERQGSGISIQPIRTPKENLLRNRKMVDDIRAIWAAAGGPPPPEERDPDIFPDRPGLY